jgi:hypothetical protein
MRACIANAVVTLPVPQIHEKREAAAASEAESTLEIAAEAGTRTMRPSKSSVGGAASASREGRVLPPPRGEKGRTPQVAGNSIDGKEIKTLSSHKAEDSNQQVTCCLLVIVFCS